jgi:hypothetical protein
MLRRPFEMDLSITDIAPPEPHEEGAASATP